MLQTRGFSLVELSIVLVILGLLTGGILSGQALIRASELRSVTTDVQRYQTAFMTFQDKYMALPGDMRNATAFWGRDDARCPTATGTTSANGTCNGSGDGGFYSPTSHMYEYYLTWQHLAMAGLIEGTYSGKLNLAVTDPPVIGSDVPASKLGSGYWAAGRLSQRASENHEIGYSDLPSKLFNLLLFTGASTSYWNGGSILRPEEAWNIDTKIDDGKPALGSLRANPQNSCATTTVSTTAEYNVASNTIRCNGLSLLIR